MQASFNYVRLSHVLTIVPQNLINIDDELDTRYKGDIKKLSQIKKNVGLQYRYEADQETTASDLGEYGAKILFNEFSIDKNSLDAIIVCTQTPDFFMPPTACYLHGKLGLSEKTLAFDINQSCSGYVYGLYTAYSMIENGSCKRILFICGDTWSKFHNPLNTPNLGGDGISITLIEHSQKEHKSYFDLGSDGKGLKYLFMPFGAFRDTNLKTMKEPEILNKNIKEKQVYMNGLEIFNFATRKEPLVFSQLLQYANYDQDKLDFVFFHQANKGILEIITNRLKINCDKVPLSIDKYANLGAASIPATLCDSVNSYEFPLQKNLKIVLGAFGAGLSWANALMTLDTDFICKKVQIYQKEKK
ncbi:3-oxoacyl-[acyl-carrier-protein] synthase III C-terminal domain-containing protein [Campylobacter aviculae]|uniref:Beta-ketoacyl-ACP synthase III n=1 Tax=Campylobacter aviculae TaxID=2510190 RepID=A0A4U7BPM0_9BACT|nr:3-oxoacyl-[acyl-carrier-protein] synthase III C-terminal domain-containing protein [Campylobacter aviculae]TKX32245.1 beta-ketoacyl-ACP synthase III [Campylobacter aviculae]